MIELSETSYIVGIWFVEVDGDFNWMCCVYSDTPTSDWRVRYRFRYFKDKRVFNSDDERHWYHATALRSKVSEAEMINSVSTFAGIIGAAKHSPVERIVVQGDVNALREKARGSGWFHASRAAVGTEN